jgi:hypothetical protein
MGYIVRSNLLPVNRPLWYTPRWPYDAHDPTGPVVSQKGFRARTTVVEAQTKNAGGVISGNSDNETAS